MGPRSQGCHFDGSWQGEKKIRENNKIINNITLQSIKGFVIRPADTVSCLKDVVGACNSHFPKVVQDRGAGRA